MSAFRKKIATLKREALPVFFSSVTHHIQPLSSSQFDQFGFFKISNASLATQQVIDSIKPHLIEINILDEMKLMNQESTLEITIPILGVADLFADFCFEDFSPHFACVLGLNGYIAKNNDEKQNNFPKPDFIVATDIIGNKFEILVDHDGKIELPEEGTGLFSIISSLTFIYSKQQVKEGVGFQQSINETEKNKLLLLPACGTGESYAITICVTHLNALRQRIVDSIRYVYIRHRIPSFEKSAQRVKVKRWNSELPNMLCLDVTLSQKNYSVKHPFAVNVMLQPLKGTEYSMMRSLSGFNTTLSHQYVKHPIFFNVYTKYVGLSEKGFTSVLKQIYSEYDFIKDFLKASFGLSNKRGYNNFFLRTEALSALYQLLIHGLVNQEIPGEFLFDRMREERLVEIDVFLLELDFHDAMVISQLREDFLDNRFEKFKALFANKNNEMQDKPIEDSFYIYAKGLNDTMPKASIEVLNQQNFTQNILTYADKTVFDEPLLGLSTYKTLHLNEVVDFSSLMTPAYAKASAYWIELENDHENKAYAFYMKNIFDKQARFRMNVTQAKHDKSYQMAMWVENSSIQKDAQMPQASRPEGDLP